MRSDWTRREFQKMLFAVSGSLLVSHPGDAQSSSEAHFRHPGLLHGTGDLSRMRQAVAEKRQPIYDGFEKLRDDPHSQLSYIMRGPFAAVGRNPTIHIAEFDSDAAAVYQCALMWATTGDDRYAVGSRNTLNAWAATLKAITGIDAVLACSLGGFLYLNGAEILRSSGQATESEVAAWRQMFLNVYLPVIREFAPFANGNWDTAALKSVMAIGVFCDDVSIFDHAVQYYLYGCGDGRISNYIYSNGQCQESGRDQAHTQLGLGHLGDCCEIAWQQGLDLYSAMGNRLLNGFEYTAKYALGGTVPFVPNIDRTGKYPHDVISVRHPRIQPVFEQIYNHYAHRMGIPAPNVESAALHIRPEGPDIADHPGLGTFTFSRTRNDVVPPPSTSATVFGLRALGSPGFVKLEWVPLHHRARYEVQRSSHVQGPYETIASGLAEPGWTDAKVAPGETYFYRVNSKGGKGTSLVTSASAGVPPPWQMQAIGKTLVTPVAQFTADTVVLEAGGSTSHELDGGLVVTRPWGDATALTARLVPRIASQFLSVGLVAENSTGSNRVAFYLAPTPIGIDEHPRWFIYLRPLGSGTTSNPLPEPMELKSPVLLYGRLIGELWFRMSQKGHALTGHVSSDGQTWLEVGELTMDGEDRFSRVGFLLNSGLESINTEVVLGHLALEK